MEKILLKSAIITPDGTELVSEHRHDFKMYVDKVTHKTYGIDGGLEYQRYIGDIDDCKKILVYVDSTSHEDFINVTRETFSWGTYGKDGKQPFRKVLLKDMTNDHIEAILDTQTHISENTKFILANELSYRKKNKIVISEEH